MRALEVCELAGTHKAMGNAYGEAFREQIQQFVDIRVQKIIDNTKLYAPDRPIDRPQVLAAAGRCLHVHETYDDDIWTEFCGIAEGAQVGWRELLICNTITDMKDYVLFANGSASDEEKNGGQLDECTAFLVPEARSSNAPIIGQTWDMHEEAKDFTVLVRRRPDNAPETLGLTTVGCLSLIGLNSEGVGIGNTNLVPTDAEIGIGYLFTITRALTASTARSAAELVVRTPRLSGHNFYIADAHATINIEASATESVITQVEGDVFTHTNHYLSHLANLEYDAYARGGSHHRYQRINHVFDTFGDRQISVDDTWNALADYCAENGIAVCMPTPPEPGGTATVATVIQVPGEGKLYACDGGARDGQRQTFSV